MRLHNIQQLRDVGNWAVTYLWDIKFEGAPAPFDAWFPASSVSEPLYSIDSHPIPAHVLTWNIPRSIQALQITVECFDDAKHTLENWYKKWFHEMFDDHRSVATLTEISRRLEIARLTPDKKVMYINRYYVYLTGSQSVTQDSANSVKKLSALFNVVGMDMQYVGATLPVGAPPPP